MDETRVCMEAKRKIPDVASSMSHPMTVQNMQTEEEEKEHSRIQRIKLADSFKEEANGRFTTENYKEANDLYTKALTILMNDEDQTQCISTNGGLSGRDELAATLYANRAACHLKLGAYVSCVDDSSAAIKINPQYVKVR